MSDKKAILSGLIRQRHSDGVFDFRESLASQASAILNMSTIQAEEFAELNLKKYWNWFVKEIDLQADRGVIPYYQVAAGGVRAYVHNSYALQASTDPDARERGRLATSRPQVLHAIDALTDREYEALACVACGAIGARNTLLTPPGNEGGIDFIATIQLKSMTHIFSAVGAEFRIIGQCKKYTSPASVDRMEQFIQTMNNVRYRSDRVRRHLPSWFEESKGPIVGWVISHDGYQTGAMDEAKKHGVVISDSIDIADLLCFSSSFNPGGLPDDRALHLIAECRRII